MRFFRREPPSRIQSLGEMVAYSLRNEATRTGWERSGDLLANTQLRAVVLSTFWKTELTVRDRDVPLEPRDRRAIAAAADAWRAWDDEGSRAEAMVDFVDAFERIACAPSPGGD